VKLRLRRLALTLTLIVDPTLFTGGEESLVLIVDPTLFTGGEESLVLPSPQPTVNNLARRARATVDNLPPGAKSPAVTPRRVTNSLAVSCDEWGEKFAPARRWGSGRILRCGGFDLCAIRPSLSPSQRARRRHQTQL
jgi:hypothetical protein